MSLYLRVFRLNRCLYSSSSIKPGITQVHMYSVPPTAAAAINHSLRGFPTKSKTAVRFPTPDFRHSRLTLIPGKFSFLSTHAVASSSYSHGRCLRPVCLFLPLSPTTFRIVGISMNISGRGRNHAKAWCAHNDKPGNIRVRDTTLPTL